MLGGMEEKKAKKKMIFSKLSINDTHGSKKFCDKKNLSTLLIEVIFRSKTEVKSEKQEEGK